ncbi:MAG: DUF4177 domain-containing protein [Chloroflexota bacterium]|nr:DUF4177 domain-containing protein [Chloroflexota bacterium]
MVHRVIGEIPTSDSRTDRSYQWSTSNLSLRTWHLQMFQLTTSVEVVLVAGANGPYLVVDDVTIPATEEALRRTLRERFLDANALAAAIEGPAAPGAPRWEYKVVAVSCDEGTTHLEQALNRHGTQGWELVSLLLAGSTYQATFKRLGL